MKRARIVDAIIVTAIVVEAFVVALLLRFEGMIPSAYWTGFTAFTALGVVAFVALLWRRLDDYGTKALAIATPIASLPSLPPTRFRRLRN